MYAICSRGRISRDFGKTASAAIKPHKSHINADSSNNAIAQCAGALNSKLLFNDYSLSSFALSNLDARSSSILRQHIP
ncbi:MAG: hypothetical protein C0469_11900 [Cyanobacteria bacterium DS2.3.42]|nr:hypothetical protein [Cyanobacteria bacterium DS2.3.42]